MFKTTCGAPVKGQIPSPLGLRYSFVMVWHLQNPTSYVSLLPGSGRPPGQNPDSNSRPPGTNPPPWLLFTSSAPSSSPSRVHTLIRSPKLRTSEPNFVSSHPFFFYFPFFSSFSSSFGTHHLVLSHCRFRFSLLLFASVFYYSASLYPSILFNCYILVTPLTTPCVRYFVYHYQT